MAERFMRIDLSDEARDFRPIALEPGVPMLDRSAANAKILYRWLGGLVAEPVWEGDSVDFYVRDDHGGRLEEVTCQPATAEDLDGLLQEDLATLKDRIEKAKPETPTERMVKKMARRSFEELTEDPNRTDLDCYFFRYRDVQGRWRLVWCWGYQRVDQEPAPSVVCTDPECALLFVRRPGQSHKCPSCEASLALRPVKKKGRRKRKALLALLLLLLLAGLYYWWTHPDLLIATPDTHTGPVGSRVEFHVTRAGLFSKEDVTHQVIGAVFDPGVARFDNATCSATFLGPGKTRIRFHLGDGVDPVDVDLIGTMPTAPDAIAIEPGEVELGIGTTAHLKLIGKYEDGTEIDLTDAARWQPLYDGPVYARDGFLEGLAKGTATVTASYQADAQSDPLSASAEVTVKEIDFASLAVTVDPSEVGLDRSSALRIDAVTEAGEKYSVLESSLLDTGVTPPYVASVEGRRLMGRQIGAGTLAVTFNENLTGEGEFRVVATPGIDKLTVYPRPLKMVVGQIADLNILTPSRAPVRVASGDTNVVEVTQDNRLIGRAVGETQVTVTQAGQETPDPITVIVASAEILSVAIDPPSIVVPVDDTVQARLMAMVRREGEETDRRIEIAPDGITTEQKPSPRYADYYPHTLELHGVTPTSPSSPPQSLALRYQDHRASAPVGVIVAPFRLALTPPGPVKLPHGQQTRLAGWATYSGGRRVQVLGERLSFGSDAPADAKPGLELRGDRVAALQPDAGPLYVFGSYFNRPSKPVEFTSTAADETVKLRLEVDRKIRLAGETGQVSLAASSAKGDVELVPELANFQSSDAQVLAIAEQTGAFRALIPGAVDVVGTHVAAPKEKAESQLTVYEPSQASLVFEPEEVTVAVDEVARLQLYLVVQDGGQTKRAPLVGPGVGYAMTEPDAVRFAPPILVGLRPVGPFELSASYYPYVGSIAKATVDVVDAAGPEAIRIVAAAGSSAPGQISLAPGQTVALRVEQQLPGSPDQWKEVRPSAVGWIDIPEELIWTPATDGLRPTVTAPEGAAEEFELRAQYGGRQAIAVIALNDQRPDPNEPGVEVRVVREGPGEYLLLGDQQRYSIVVEKNGVSEPVASVLWPDDFENPYVRWQAPVLWAKRAGHRQQLRAEVDGRVVLFSTTTYQPGEFQVPPPPKDRPLVVRIQSDQTTPQDPVVRFPVGAIFNDFYVEAEYPDNFTRYPTDEATLTTPEPEQSAYVSGAEGRLVGLRPGRTQVFAEFEGVKSAQPLVVEVVDQLDADQIRIAPSPINLQPGESYALEIEGFKAGRSIGIITSLGNVTWQSDNPAVAGMSGSTVTGLSAGQARVTARFGQITSPPAEVNVGMIAEGLVADNPAIRIFVGQGVRIGTDLKITRGEDRNALDVSRLCAVSPAFPEVVQYVPETQSLVGRSPGTSAVAFTLGDKLTNVMVEVVSPAGGVIDGMVQVEPSSSNLAAGQALPLRVFVVDPQTGARIDRADSAVLASSNPAAVAIRGNLVCALQPGAAEITATVQGAQQTGKAHVAVNNEAITDLIVEPPYVRMSPGDLQRLRILGRAASGTYELFPQPDLTVTAAGQNPAAIRISGSNEIDAVSPGSAIAAVNFRQLHRDVSVEVGDDALTDLRIEPAEVTVPPGQPLRYRVTAMQGGRLKVLGPQHGVNLFVENPQVAQAIPGELTVVARDPGRTAVIARLGDRQAEAFLFVEPGARGIAGPDVIVDGPGDQIVDLGHLGGTYGRRYWDGTRWVIGDGPVYQGPGGVVAAPPGVAERLRFRPEVVRLDPNSPPTGFRVFEVLPDGSDGREVTDEPGLEFQVPPTGSVVTVQRVDGRPVLQPTGQSGQTRVAARLGELTAHPMLVSVGDVVPGLVAGTGRLILEPNPLVVWPGEVRQFDRVLLDPGGGQPPRPVDYRIAQVLDPTKVEAAGEKMVRGKVPGTTQVVLAVVDPAGVYSGVSATATVQVVSAGNIRVDPPAVSLQIGQPTPRLSVISEGQGGVTFEVPAVLESMDPSVLAPDPQYPGRFVARSIGGTEIRATYRGKEAFCSVTISGRRFEQVRERLDRGTDDFSVILEVLAAASENALEYRVSVAEQPGAETPWTRATRLADGSQQVTIHSPRMRYGPPNSLYNLVIEARASADETPQRYPFTFRLRPEIERTDNRQPGETFFP